MTFEELQDLLAEQFSCDTGDLTRSTALADLDADHEDMIELAWALGEAIGVEIDESELKKKGLPMFAIVHINAVLSTYRRWCFWCARLSMGC